MSNLKLSTYQKDILDWVKYGHGNAIIKALAGSGKTTILKECVNIIPEKQKILMLAFNKSIAEELKSKIDKNNVHIKTLHALGYSIILNHFNELNINSKIDDNKYKNHLNKHIDNYIIDLEINNNKLKVYKNTVLKLCSLGRLYLCKTEFDLKKLLIPYNIMPQYNELTTAMGLIEWGYDYDSIVNEYGEFVLDFTDMVFVPNVLNLKCSYKYDFILCDEVQDFSVAQQGIFFKTFKRGSRFIGVGDGNQLINFFAGSSQNSYNKLLKTPNTIELPLSISYRCPKRVGKLAKTFVPEFEVREDAPEGSVNYEVSINKIKDGDMVLCRNNQPLFMLYLKLIGENKKCFFKNKEITTDLIELILNNYCDNTNDLYQSLYNSLIDIKNKISIEKTISEDEVNNDDYIVSLNENIQILKIIGEGISNTNDLINKINSIFDNDANDGILLMTIHTAKGLQAKNVFILKKSLLHNKKNKSDEQMQESLNLEYVAYTRAEETLNFLTEKELINNF